MNNQKSFYLGLLFKCPLDKENKNCSFADVRTKKPAERIEYYDKIDDVKFMKLIELHNSCLNLEEEK